MFPNVNRARGEAEVARAKALSDPPGARPARTARAAWTRRARKALAAGGAVSGSRVFWCGLVQAAGGASALAGLWVMAGPGWSLIVGGLSAAGAAALAEANGAR